MIKASARKPANLSVLSDRAARRPGLRHHDPQYRLSMTAATTMCNRNRQITEAKSGDQGLLVAIGDRLTTISP
jgi:hypothetical protein